MKFVQITEIQIGNYNLPKTQTGTTALSLLQIEMLIQMIPSEDLIQILIKTIKELTIKEEEIQH